jgi:leucyl aminopeptidase (aminopeptidase T)
LSKRPESVGEIFTSPVEDSLNGWMQFSFPAIYKSVHVGQVRPGFRDGRIVETESEKNELSRNRRSEPKRDSPGSDLRHA